LNTKLFEAAPLGLDDQGPGVWEVGTLLQARQLKLALREANPRVDRGRLSQVPIAESVRIGASFSDP